MRLRNRQIATVCECVCVGIMCCARVLAVIAQRPDIICSIALRYAMLIQ